MRIASYQERRMLLTHGCVGTFNDTAGEFSQPSGSAGLSMAQ